MNHHKDEGTTATNSTNLITSNSTNGIRYQIKKNQSNSSLPSSNGVVKQREGVDSNKMAAAKNVAENVKLIELVKQFPLLYDTQLEDYKDASKKEGAWMFIALSMEWPVESCQTRWKSLRDSFRKKDKISLLANNGNGATNAAAGQWRYRDMLSFLKHTNDSRRLLHNTDGSAAITAQKLTTSTKAQGQRLTECAKQHHETANRNHSGLARSNSSPAPAIMRFQNTHANNSTDSNCSATVVKTESSADAEESATTDISTTGTADGSPAPYLNDERKIVALSDSSARRKRSRPSIHHHFSNNDVDVTIPLDVKRVKTTSGNGSSAAVASSTTLCGSSASHSSASTVVAKDRIKTSEERSHVTKILNHLAKNSQSGSITSHVINGQSGYNTNHAMMMINGGGGVQSDVSGSHVTNGESMNHVTGGGGGKKELDADELFALSVAATLSRCTVEQRSLAKIEIMRILHVATLNSFHQVL